ncbi:MAG: hypothetical protein PVF37_19715 [Desulfobacterales bacterium]|jgi:hypothetical protein
MKKEDLKKLAENKNYISGIYNYCDRWCERCPFTSRCMNFAMSEEYTTDSEASDINNEKFWQSLSDIFKVTREMLEETAEELGIDINAIDYEEISQEESIKDRIVENHECCRQAKKYSELVDDLFESEYIPSLKVIGRKDIEKTGESINTHPSQGPVAIEEVLEIIQWYQHFIYVKLMRSIRGTLGDDSEFEDEYPKDSDGSAKVALIAIERSMAAWTHMHTHFPSHQDQILDILNQLDRLRKRVETIFPEARNFVRPGFDETNSA